MSRYPATRRLLAGVVILTATLHRPSPYSERAKLLLTLSIPVRSTQSSSNLGLLNTKLVSPLVRGVLQNSMRE